MQTKKLLFGILCIMVLCAFQIPEDTDPFKKIIAKLANYIANAKPEKIYIHTDKPYYTNGETIWFKSYLVDGITHLASDVSRVVHVELISPSDSIISRRQLFIETNNAKGDFTIPKNAITGDYLIRAYTNYMRNAKEPTFFQKEIRIWNQKIKPSEITEIQTAKLVNRDTIVLPKDKRMRQSRKPSLKFYPEGGYLVNGISTIMGIKATDHLGNDVELKGTIKDESGRAVSFFKTYRFGLGTVPFKPEIGKNYYASVMINDLEETYPIPDRLLSGYVMNIINKRESITIKVQTNRSNGLKGTLLLGHLRGAVFLSHEQKDSHADKDVYTIKLPINETLGSGVAQFTLFTSAGDPICERLVFIDNTATDPTIKITTNKKIYKPRESAMISLAIQDKKESLLKGNFSVSITEKNNVIYDPENGTIKSWLLLDSDLKGTIHNPGFYFEKNPKNNTLYLLDALMLTHGWRRFVWKDLLQNKIQKIPEFPIEKGLIIKGKTTVLDKPYKPKFSLASINFFSKNMYSEKKYTDEYGRFRFGPYILLDSIKTFIQATDPHNTKKSKQKELSILLDPPAPEPLINRAYKKPMDAKTISYAKRYLAMARRKKIIDYQYDPEATILDEVLLESKVKTKEELIAEEIDELTNYGEPQTRIFVDSVSSGGIFSILDLVRRAPGVQVRGNIHNPQITIGGANLALNRKPLILLDGFQISISQIATMSASAVSFIDVLRSNQAAILGANTSGGAIAIYTYRGFSFGEQQQRSPGIIDFTSPGFYKAREFFSPNYYKNKPEHQKPDYRTTLYWDPNVVCDGKSNALINFYTGDTKGDYLISIEGITKTGVPIKATHNFVVE